VALFRFVMMIPATISPFARSLRGKRRRVLCRKVTAAGRRPPEDCLDVVRHEVVTVPGVRLRHREQVLMVVVWQAARTAPRLAPFLE
jgi:hypothetical protein